MDVSYQEKKLIFYVACSQIGAYSQQLIVKSIWEDKGQKTELERLLSMYITFQKSERMKT